MGQAETESPSDEVLFERYAKGGEEAFALLYSRYSKKLFSFLKIKLGLKQGHLADELFQKTWLKVHLAKHAFRTSEKFAPWFFTVALNTYRDEVNSAAERYVHVEFEEELSSPTQSSGETDCLRRELIARIHSFLVTLPENQRVALLLADEEGLSSKEIANAMRLSDAAVRKLISRARNSVRSEFKEDQV